MPIYGDPCDARGTKSLLCPYMEIWRSPCCQGNQIHFMPIYGDPCDARGTKSLLRPYMEIPYVINIKPISVNIYGYQMSPYMVKWSDIHHWPEDQEMVQPRPLLFSLRHLTGR